MSNPAIRAVRRLVSDHPKLRTALLSGREMVQATRHLAASAVPTLIHPQAHNLTIAVTARCNLRCTGCRYERDFMNGHQLSLPMVRDVLRDAAELGFREIRLYGGEPLLHPDLCEMVAFALQEGLEPYITTNATLLDRRIEELLAAGLRAATVGFYGVGSAYDEYTGRPGAYAKLERSFERVRALCGDAFTLRINWLLCRPSCTSEALHGVLAFARKFHTPIQVDLVHYSLPYFTEGPERCLQFRPEDRDAIDAVVAELLSVKSSEPWVLDTSEMAIRSIPDWLLRGPSMQVPCDKYRMTWVGADGTVQLCYVGFPLGNLHEHRLRDLLFGDTHVAAARAAFSLSCPNCHCSYAARTTSHWPSRLKYGRMRHLAGQAL